MPGGYSHTEPEVRYENGSLGVAAALLRGIPRLSTSNCSSPLRKRCGSRPDELKENMNCNGLLVSKPLKPPKTLHSFTASPTALQFYTENICLQLLTHLPRLRPRVCAKTVYSSSCRSSLLLASLASRRALAVPLRSPPSVASGLPHLSRSAPIDGCACARRNAFHAPRVKAAQRVRHSSGSEGAIGCWVRVLV